MYFIVISWGLQYSRRNWGGDMYIKYNMHEKKIWHYIPLYTETSVNAGLYSRLCLNLLNPPWWQLDTSTVVCLTAAILMPLISYAWLLLDSDNLHIALLCWLTLYRGAWRGIREYTERGRPYAASRHHSWDSLIGLSLVRACTCYSRVASVWPCLASPKLDGKI
jgi:hypothetical protein